MLLVTSNKFWSMGRECIKAMRSTALRLRSRRECLHGFGPEMPWLGPLVTRLRESNFGPNTLMSLKLIYF